MDRETLAASVTGTAAQLRLQLSDITAASQMLEQTTSGDRARAYLASAGCSGLWVRWSCSVG